MDSSRSPCAWTAILGARYLQHLAQVIQKGVLVGPLRGSGLGPLLHERIRRLRHCGMHRDRRGGGEKGKRLATYGITT
jgi:hypothetical protein